MAYVAQIEFSNWAAHCLRKCFRQFRLPENQQEEEENDLHLMNEKKGIKYFGKLGRNEIKTEE